MHILHPDSKPSFSHHSNLWFTNTRGRMELESSLGCGHNCEIPGEPRSHSYCNAPDQKRKTLLASTGETCAMSVGCPRTCFISPIADQPMQSQRRAGQPRIVSPIWAIRAVSVKNSVRIRLIGMSWGDVATVLDAVLDLVLSDKYATLPT